MFILEHSGHCCIYIPQASGHSLGTVLVPFGMTFSEVLQRTVEDAQ